jgi:hypothetical protein
MGRDPNGGQVMRKYLYGVPTILASGFIVSFMWGMVFNEVPANARPELPSTEEALRGFKRIRDNMPNMDTFFGIREVFRKINEGIR